LLCLSCAKHDLHEQLVSFTGGNGLYGYTELSEVYYAKARALADASNVLPYFAGSGLVVARRYDDQIVTSPVINNVFLCLTILAAFLMGLISALFVPRLPRDIPRRGFDLYSWLSAFHAHELVAVHPAGISKDMDLRDIQDYTSELRFRHVG
jgi:nitrate reductase gamma subunit